MAEERHHVVTVRLNAAQKAGLADLARLYGVSMGQIMRILLSRAMVADEAALRQLAERDREREGVRG